MQSQIPKYYSLSEITASIRSVVSKTYNSAYWVKAEIVKMNCYPYSGHCYPDLAEKNNNKVIAQIRATIWSGTYQNIQKKFIKETGQELSQGMTVLFLVRVTFHELHGLSLNILDVEPSFTLGEMAKGKKETIKRLVNEGVFDKNKLLPFPLLPKRVAVVSVETSKGYQDFVKMLENNRKGYYIEYHLFAALLQGDNAVDSIVLQLNNIASKAEQFDVVTIIRGGGGDVGLNAYDQYKLAKTVAEFPLPVITGIGHSTNETVTEMVAYANKITPTEVAVFLLEKFENINMVLENLTLRLTNASEELIIKEKHNIEHFATIIEHTVSSMVEKNKAQLQLLNEKLKNGTKTVLHKHSVVLEQVAVLIYFKPEKILTGGKTKVLKLKDKLQIYTKQIFKEQKTGLDHLETKVRLLSPETIINRGYSLTFVNGQILKDINKITVGNEMKTIIKGGELFSKIEKIKKK